MSELTDNKTSVTSITGKFRTGTTAPTDSDAAGIQAGDVYINTDDKTIHFYDGSKWITDRLTTTSTSTSTTTSTTTTA